MWVENRISTTEKYGRPVPEKAGNSKWLFSEYLLLTIPVLSK